MVSPAQAVRLTIGAPRVYAHLPATKESRTQICRELREAVMSLGHDARSVTGPRQLSKDLSKQALACMPQEIDSKPIFNREVP